MNFHGMVVISGSGFGEGYRCKCNCSPRRTVRESRASGGFDWKGKYMPHPVDVHVGKRIRHRRWLVGMTQQQLAERVGIKFQQIQKYETGANRVSASRLWDIADALEVEISFFFEGLEEESDHRDGAEALPSDLLGDKEALDLVRSYYAIPENQRRRLFDLARVLSEVA